MAAGAVALAHKTKVKEAMAAQKELEKRFALDYKKKKIVMLICIVCGKCGN